MCRRIVTVLLLMATQLDSWPTQSYQHQQRVFMSQMSRDNSRPVQTGFVFSQMNNNPAKIETFGQSSTFGDGFVPKYSDLSNHESTTELADPGLRDLSMDRYNGMSVLNANLPLGDLKSNFENSAFLTATESSMPYTTKSWTEHSINYEISKAKSKYSSDPLLSLNAKSDQIKDRMQSLININFPSDTLNDKIPKYDFNREFHIDDDDVKTSTRNTYEWWPFFSHNPYEYEHMKIDSDIQKAKEKRYAISSPDRVIPVHERYDDYSDSYSTPPPLPQSKYPRVQTNYNSDNPIQADEPFFAFVLNDYYDKHSEDDSLTFKGLDWGSDFDIGNQDVPKEYGKRDSSLNDYHADLERHNNIDNGLYDAVNKRMGESATERGYDRNHKFDKHENGESQKENHNHDRAHSGEKQVHYKDIVDQFANKFGGEDHKRHSNFSLKTNKENNEKRKGFRRVYHKDEYQEDKEFFDNTGNSANSEDSGSSTIHNGGSVAGVQSHAAAVLGNEANAFKDIGNTEHNKFDKKHSGNDAKHGFDRDFNRYVDMAKQTAHSNKAAYFE